MPSGGPGERTASLPALSHYEVLGLAPRATEEQIRAQYRDLALKYHPSISPGPDSEVRFQLIADAFRVLADPVARAAYDLSLRQQPVAHLAAPEATQSWPAPSPALPQVALPGQNAEEAIALAAELAKRGVPRDEIHRLTVGNAPPPKQKGKAKPAAPDMDFVIPPAPSFVPKPTVILPDPRESTAEERQQADRLLTAANIARRRGQFGEAEQSCRQAVDLIPGDSAAVELYGDILQATGRVDDAAAAYRRAADLDPKRGSAERKYAHLSLLQDRTVAMLRDEGIQRSPRLAVVLSALMPGVGQIYTGRATTGVVILAAMMSCIYLLGWTRYGFPKSREPISASLVILLVAGIGLYAYSIIDAKAGAYGRRRKGTGWEV